MGLVLLSRWDRRQVDLLKESQSESSTRREWGNIQVGLGRMGERRLGVVEGLLSRAATPAEARDHGLVMAAVCMAGRVSPAVLSSTDGGSGVWRRMRRERCRRGGGRNRS